MRPIPETTPTQFCGIFLMNSKTYLVAIPKKTISVILNFIIYLYLITFITKNKFRIFQIFTLNYYIIVVVSGICEVQRINLLVLPTSASRHPRWPENTSEGALNNRQSVESQYESIIVIVCARDCSALLKRVFSIALAIGISPSFTIRRLFRRKPSRILSRRKR